MVSKVHILSLDLPALESWCRTVGLPPFRAKQILDWIYKKQADSFESMSNLPKQLRAKLAQEFDLFASTIARRAVSSDGTTKLLLKWPDDATCECVLIPDDPR